LIPRNSQKGIINSQSFATGGVPKGRPLRLCEKQNVHICRKQYLVKMSDEKKVAVGSRQKAVGSPPSLKLRRMRKAEGKS